MIRKQLGTLMVLAGGVGTAAVLAVACGGDSNGGGTGNTGNLPAGTGGVPAGMGGMGMVPVGGTGPAPTPMGGTSGGTGGAPGTMADPWSLKSYLELPTLANRVGPSGIDNKGQPGAGSTLTGAAFTKPAMWNGFPVPAYFTNTAYVGAFEPGKPAWTDGWTIGINGNSAVWDFAKGEPNTALATATAPVANKSCPAGTTLAAQSFAQTFGPLTNDEAKLFVAAGDYDICELTSFEQAGTIKLTNDNVYRLAAMPVRIGNGYQRTTVVAPASRVTAVLEIEAGTLIFGFRGQALAITRGSKIMANGTKENPIVMTSEDQLKGRFDGSPSTPIDTNAAEWGGLVLMGRAKSNECVTENDPNCDVEAEGQVGSYGGNDDSDSSGSLKYVIVRHAGFDVDGNGNELNGISYFGTGSGTLTDYVQVHRNFDDGVEHFGSADFIGHVVLTSNGDDSLDWGQGWRGGAQHVVVLQSDVFGDFGIEADNDETNSARAPVSFPLLANLTILGPANPGPGVFAGGTVLLRRGTKVQIWNSVFSRAKTGCIDVDDLGTFAHVPSPTMPSNDLLIRNSVFDCQIPFVLE